MPSQTTTDYLLAKSIKNGLRVTLEQHSLDTATAAQLIFDPDTRVGRNFRRAFKLDDDSSAAFMLNLSIAGLFHDIGKANEGFLQAVGGKANAQVIRHEHLSALILQLPEIIEWLSAGSPRLRRDAIVAAVLSHHLKAEPGKIGLHPSEGFIRHCELHLDHQEVKEILAKVQELAKLPSPPRLPYPRYHFEYEPWTSCIQQLEVDAQAYRRSLRKNPQEHQFVAALKCALIVADSVSSGIVRTGGDIADWIQANVHLPSLSKEELYEKIIEPRLANLKSRSQAKDVQIRPFQAKAAEMGDHSMLIAGCGSGKTLAGLLWAANRLECGEYGRVLFLYPTRGTATEGFKDYIGWAPEKEAMLLHGSSQYALESMLENPPDCADDGKKDYRLAEDRLFSLSNYPRRFFSATVDQFLSFLQHGYGGICMSVALADSVVIIDEIHSFDQQLFNTLLAHLKFLQIPTLCMTATLQKERSAELNACGIQVFPGPEDRQELQDLAKKEEHPRYRFVREVDVANLIPLAVKMATEGNERILWVVNTVARCQELCQQLAQELKPEFGDRVIAYHSRFRLMDRDARHQQAVAKFRFDSNSAGLIAVTTQVCEMSLDLDADRLITELAPIPSLIQRCGRANRHESRGQDFVAQVHIYMPENHKPYDREDLKQADKMVADIAQKKHGVSQRDLSDAMMQYGTNIELGLKAQSLLFESGYFAKPGELRDIDEYTVPAILDNDLKAVQDLFAKKKPLDAYIVPVPERFALKSRVSWLPAYLRCAPAAQYSEALGFLNEGKRNG